MCSAETPADITACCKLDDVPDKCETITDPDVFPANLQNKGFPNDFCGAGKVYDDTKANTNCATTTCSNATTVDIAACCKLDDVPDKCSTTPADFCGTTGKYDSTKANADCAGTVCDKNTAADIAECCITVTTTTTTTAAAAAASVTITPSSSDTIVIDSDLNTSTSLENSLALVMFSLLLTMWILD